MLHLLGSKALIVRQMLHFKPHNFPSKIVGKRECYVFELQAVRGEVMTNPEG